MMGQFVLCDVGMNFLYCYLIVFRQISGFRGVSGSHPRYLEQELKCEQWQSTAVRLPTCGVSTSHNTLAACFVTESITGRGVRVRPCVCVVRPQHSDLDECMRLPTGHNPTVTQALGVLAKINMHRTNLGLSSKYFSKLSTFPPYSRRQNCEIKQAPYWGPTIVEGPVSLNHICCSLLSA
jgi:hypothetical protein